MSLFIKYLKKNSFIAVTLTVSLFIRILFSLDNVKSLIVDIDFVERVSLNILENGIMSMGTFHPPVYPLFLAAIFKLFGHNLLYVYIIQSVLGTVNTLLIYLIAQNVFGARIAKISAIMSFLYWPLTLYSGIGLSEVLFLFLLLWAIFLLLRGFDTGRWVYFLFCGMLMALSTLTRSINMLFLAMVPGVYLFFAGNARKYVKNTAVFVIMFCVTLAPWIIRNYYLYQALIPVDSVGGLNLYIGNNPRANGFFVDVSKDPLYDATGAFHEVDSRLKSAAVDYIIHNPVRFITLSAWRGFLFIVFDVLEFDWAVKAFADKNFLFHFPLLQKFMHLCNLLFFAFGLVGLKSLFKNKKGMLLAGVILYYFAVMSVFYIQARYRLPIMPFMAVASALAVEAHILMKKSSKSPEHVQNG